MAEIICVMGKSSTGKDTIFERLSEIPELSLKKIVTYTTRPIRAGETDGREYFFVTKEREKELSAAGKIIESRSYDTVYGKWDYFTVDDGQIDADGDDSYIIIATLESFEKLRDFYRNAAVVPIYIYVEDGLRLERALNRERAQAVPRYDEMCRRFLGDAVDFSDEKLKKTGVVRTFENRDIKETTAEIAEYIRTGRIHGY